MSASRTPTDNPRAAIAAARFTVTLDLPTPPLPDATAYTRVSEPGWANGITGSRASPRSCLRSSVRCSSFMTSRVTLTAPVPGTSATAWRTRSEISVFFGQAAVVRYTSTCTPASASTLTLLTMPSSVIGRRSSGSITLPSPARTAVSSSVRDSDITAECRPTRRAVLTAGVGRGQATGPGGGPNGCGPGGGGGAKSGGGAVRKAAAAPAKSGGGGGRKAAAARE